MEYVIDCEFSKFGGTLISMALVPMHVDNSLYLVNDQFRTMPVDPWVKENVIPLVYGDIPFDSSKVSVIEAPLFEFPRFLSQYFKVIEPLGKPRPTVIADWPEDLVHFFRTMLTGPGTAIPVEHVTAVMSRSIDAYPSELPNLVQHNAYHDALAIRHVLQKERSR